MNEDSTTTWHDGDIRHMFSEIAMDDNSNYLRSPQSPPYRERSKSFDFKSSPTEVSTNNAPSVVDEDEFYDEKDTEKKILPTIFACLGKQHELLRWLQLFFLSFVLFIPAILFHCYHPSFQLFGGLLVHWFYFLGFIWAGLCVAQIILFFLLKGIMSISVFSSSNILFYIRESLNHFIALMWFVFLNIFVDINIWPWLTDSLGDAPSQLVLTLAFYVLLLLIKKHYLISLAVSFNHSNYLGRIKDALVLEEILKKLGKAKLNYRGKKIKLPKLTRSIQKSAPAFEVPDLIIPIPDSPLQTDNASIDSSDDIFADESSHHLLQRFFNLISVDKNKYDSSKTDSTKELRRSSRIDARRFFKWLRTSENDKSIQKQHFSPYLSPGQVTEIVKKFQGPLMGIKEIEEGLFRIYRERHRLARSLTSVHSAVEKIDQIVNVVIFFVSIFVGALIFGQSLKEILVLYSTILVGAAFAVGNSAKTTFESIVFLFGNHPFDIGDRVLIPMGDSPSVYHHLVVVDINLLSTVFERHDGIWVTIPNSVLCGKMIMNIRRSTSITETFEFVLPFKTDISKIGELKARIDDYIYMKQSHYFPKPTLQMEKIGAEGVMTLQLQVQHRGNFQSLGPFQEKHSELLYFLVKSLKELNFDYKKLHRVEMTNNPLLIEQ